MSSDDLDFDLSLDENLSSNNSSGFGFEKGDENNLEIDTLDLTEDLSFDLNNPSEHKLPEESVKQIDKDMFKKFSEGIKPESPEPPLESELKIELEDDGLVNGGYVR